MRSDGEHEGNPVSERRLRGRQHHLAFYRVDPRDSDAWGSEHPEDLRVLNWIGDPIQHSIPTAYSAQFDRTTLHPVEFVGKAGVQQLAIDFVQLDKALDLCYRDQQATAVRLPDHSEHREADLLLPENRERRYPLDPEHSQVHSHWNAQVQ